jgi:hypothetical protein
MDGISAPMGDCVKIWLLYPPTDHNLAWMRQEKGQHGKLFRGGDHLEGGVIVQTNSAEALYIPSGCIHAVFTVSGGFLVSIDCTTRFSLWPFSQYLRHRLHLELDLTGQEHCYFLFLECLKVALANSCELTAIRSWISVEDLLEAEAAGNPEWRRSATAVWEIHFVGERGGDQACPCGVLGINLEQHVRAQHLEWLLGCEIGKAERPRGGKGRNR